MVVAAVVAVPAVEAGAAAGTEIAATFAVRALTNIALTIGATWITDQLPEDKKKKKDTKDTVQQVKEIGVSTVVTTAVSAFLGPEVKLGTALIASLGAGQVSQKLVGGTPASDALDSLINISSVLINTYEEKHPDLSPTVYPKTSPMYQKYKAQAQQMLDVYNNYHKQQSNNQLGDLVTGAAQTAAVQVGKNILSSVLEDAAVAAVI